MAMHKSDELQEVVKLLLNNYRIRLKYSTCNFVKLIPDEVAARDYIMAFNIRWQTIQALYMFPMKIIRSSTDIYEARKSEKIFIKDVYTKEKNEMISFTTLFETTRLKK